MAIVKRELRQESWQTRNAFLGRTIIGKNNVEVEDLNIHSFNDSVAHHTH